MAYALIPGAGGSAWYWHRLAPLLSDAIPIDLPADDDSADLTTYVETVFDAVSGVSRPLILAAQSMGAFTAPMVAVRVPVASIVLVNPMVPLTGESPGQWWAATGHDQVVAEFDPVPDELAPRILSASAADGAVVAGGQPVSGTLLG
jgi:pimeloyl-ACP methyl ester carboxylesterase